MIWVTKICTIFLRVGQDGWNRPYFILFKANFDDYNCIINTITECTINVSSPHTCIF